MILNRGRQLELVNLTIFWVFAVMIQVGLCQTIDDFISDHVFKADFVASNQFLVWVYYMAHDRLFWGCCLGLICGWGTILLKGQIELETALYLTGLVAVCLGAIPLMLGKGSTNWRYPLFFIECAPLCALFWQSFHLFSLWFEGWKARRADKAKDLKDDVKAGKVEDGPKAKVPEQALVEETKEPKKEDKSAERKPVLPKEPPAEPPQKTIWRID